jgi:putative peptidoglycan lipid II flippase
MTEATDLAPRVPAPSLRRATMGMAVGTGLSRLTGVGRVFALAYVLGFHRLGDAYNLANTTPNMLFDIILGGVLSATFLPVFVERLTNRPEREAWRSISAVLTLSLVVLVAATVACWVGSPWIIDALTALDHGHGVSAASLAQERAVATSLLRWFVPQVFFYGAISLATALLNTRRRFGAPMWVPIANNVICIGVLLWFRHVVGNTPSLAGVHLHSSQILILGLGTTAGVAVQALLLLPSLGRAGLGHLHWRWDPRNEAVATMARLGGWTFGFVVANQVALFVSLALAGSVGPGSVSAYTYAYTFMQMPYAVVAVSVMSAVAPDLARFWSSHDRRAFKHRLHSGLRAELAIILPAATGMVLLARPAVALLLGHGTTRLTSTAGTGPALAIFAVGLPGFCTFLYVVRVLQSMQRTRVAFWLYIIENGLNIALALALVHPLGVRGLAISLSVAYTIAAAIGLFVLRSWLGRLGAPGSWQPLRGVGVATAVMGVAVLVVVDLSGSASGFGLLLRVAASVATGVVVFAGTAAALASRQRSPRPRSASREPWQNARPSSKGGHVRDPDRH